MKRLIVCCLVLLCRPLFAAEPLSLVVMDPLALPLSCPCVEGYAQRDYDKFGKYLSDELGRPVTVTFAETLENALAKSTCPHIDLVIGKESVARAQGGRLNLELTPLAKLTGKDGRSTQTGLIVVRSADPAQKVSDLAGYRVLYGPEDCVEKFGAARDLLALAGVDVIPAEQAETSAACSDGACKIIEWGDTQKGAAVISSYAAPLLEGCGTVKKGDLRVVGETKPVPFIVAFASNRLSADEQAAVQQALLGAVKSKGMLTALESMFGFVPLEQEDVAVEPTSTEAPPSEKNASWPGWLGPQRNGHCDWLPAKLPEPLNVVWRHPLDRSGLGGLAATDEYVLFGDRDAANMADVFRCLDTESGEELWTVTYPAPGQLDYDNSPRATPLIVGDRAVFFGAFGDLTCADLATGLPLWRWNVRQLFGATDELPWGTCSSPLLVDNALVVNPGAPDASLVALSIDDGSVKWQTPGEPQGYGSLNLLTLGCVRQIVGHTQTLLCGWHPETGELLWEYQPPNEGDFNVPTPIEVAGQLLVCTENNAARLFAFDESGRIVPEPAAVCETLTTDTCTPVARDGKVYCASGKLLMLDANAGLNVLATLKDDAFTDYSPLVISSNRLLIQARGGELLLVDTTVDEPTIVSRAHLAAGEDRSADLYTAPAIVGTRLFVRTEREVVCVELKTDLGETESNDTTKVNYPRPQSPHRWWEPEAVDYILSQLQTEDLAQSVARLRSEDNMPGLYLRVFGNRLGEHFPQLEWVVWQRRVHKMVSELEQLSPQERKEWCEKILRESLEFHCETLNRVIDFQLDEEKPKNAQSVENSLGAFNTALFLCAYFGDRAEVVKGLNLAKEQIEAVRERASQLPPHPRFAGRIKNPFLWWIDRHGEPNDQFKVSILAYAAQRGELSDRVSTSDIVNNLSVRNLKFVEWDAHSTEFEECDFRGVKKREVMLRDVVSRLRSFELSGIPQPRRDAIIAELMRRLGKA